MAEQSEMPSGDIVEWATAKFRAKGFNVQQDDVREIVIGITRNFDERLRAIENRSPASERELYGGHAS